MQLLIQTSISIFIWHVASQRAAQLDAEEFPETLPASPSVKLWNVCGMIDHRRKNGDRASGWKKIMQGSWSPRDLAASVPNTWEV